MRVWMHLDSGSLFVYVIELDDEGENNYCFYEFYAKKYRAYATVKAYGPDASKFEDLGEL